MPQEAQERPMTGAEVFTACADVVSAVFTASWGVLGRIFGLGVFWGRSGAGDDVGDVPASKSRRCAADSVIGWSAGAAPSSAMVIVEGGVGTGTATFGDGASGGSPVLWPKTSGNHAEPSASCRPVTTA